ncbi:Membrane-associated transporter protein [Trichoplax sp. H2]|nr:Membrane-associated transporter protein [Trichoplax sp. H2]|eukprot:RDD36021.1 Membrane-associated transporter protein [Trichoplax sp. H2]
MDQSRDENDTHKIQEADSSNNHDGCEDETQELKSNSKYDKRLVIKLAILSLASFPPEAFYTFYSLFAVPLQLKLGIPIGLTLIPMIIASVIGLFLTPIIGNLSDQCTSRIGRRRPFIIVLFIINLISAAMISYSRIIGDKLWPHHLLIGRILLIIGLIIDMICCCMLLSPARAFVMDAAPIDIQVIANSLITCSAGIGAVAITAISGINWRETPLAKVFGGQVEVVFILIAAICIIVMLIATVSYAEVPYVIVDSTEALTHKSSSRKNSDDLKISTMDSEDSNPVQLMVIQHDQTEVTNDSTEDKPQVITAEEISSWNHFYQTYYFAKTMPKELVILWMGVFLSCTAYIAFTSFLTDFLGQSVYHGNPLAAKNSTALYRYNHGVSIGSWGLLGCTAFSIVYSLALGQITKYVGAVPLLVIGYSVTGIGTLVIALTNQVIVILCMAALQGIGLASAYTLLFAILASYHDYFTKIKDSRWSFRELGLDISLLTVSLSLSCIITGCFLGAIVALVRSSRAAMIFSSICNGLCAVNCIFIFKVPNDA